MTRKTWIVEKFTMKSIFNGAMFVGAFILAQISVMLPWLLRSAFARVLIETVEITLENNAILKLAVNVRWKK